MREIKFRAWDKNKKEWLFDFRLHPHGSVMKVVGEKDGKWQYSTNIHEDIELVQFTGLKDKNGKEIYEGDILIQSPGFGCEWKSRIGLVKYEFASFWLVLKKQVFILDDHDCQFEVIGNIYENPELLK